MYIEHVPNRNSPPAILLRESYRDGNTVKKRTLANLSSLPAEVIEGLKVLLRGGVAVSCADEAFVIERSLPHGHVAAVLGAARACGAEQWLASAPAALRSVVMALLVARVVSPASRLATHRMLCEQTATHSLSRLLGLEDVDLEQVYAALDWLGEAQEGIGKRLARQHLAGSTLVLYDLTSTWVTGRCCELAVHGYSRDGKRDDPQIVFGLVCTPEGCPVAVEVFAGNTADPATVRAHVFLCMLAYYVEWHMREKLKPMLFDDEYVEQARATRASPVAKARRSDQAKAKDATKFSEDGLPVHSFRTLLDDLATLAYNVCHIPLNPQAKIVMITRLTPVQEEAFRLLNVSPVACYPVIASLTRA